MANEILLIDSSESDRKDIGNFLESLGYKIFYAQNSKDGMRIFDKQQPDLVIVEVLLSGPMNGLKMAKHFKGVAEEWVKVIVTSKLYQSRAMARDATNKYKADAYFEKPFSMRDLFDTICKLIGEPPQKPQRAPKMTDRLKKYNKFIEKHKEKLKEEEAKKKKEALEKPEKTTEEITEPSEADPVPEKEPETKPDPGPKEEPPTPSPGKTETAPPPEPSSLSVAEKGEVNRENLAELLHMVFERKIDGVLQLDYPEGIKHAFLVQGQPVFVQSNIRSESIGQILLSGGHLTQEQYQEVIEEAAATKKKIGSICVQKEFLTSKQLHQILTDQTAIKIANCFAWDQGKYALDLTRKYPENAPIFEVTPSKVILLAYKAYYPFEELKARFETEADKVVYSGKEETYAGLVRELDERQQALLGKADGTMTLAELAQDADADHDEFIKFAYALIVMGVFRLGTVKRDKDLREYEPEPAVEKQEPSPLDKTSEAINEMYMRLENEDDFSLLGVNTSTDTSTIGAKLNSIADKFNPAKLPEGTSKAIQQKLERIGLWIVQARQRLLDHEKRQDYIKSLMKTREPVAREPRKTGIIDLPKELKDGEKPLVGELFFRKGIYAVENGRYHQAVEYFQKACDLEPKTGEYHVRLGYAMFLMLTTPKHSLDDAVNHVKHGLKLSPFDPTAYQKLARIEKHRKNYGNALDYLKTAIGIDPENEEILMEMKELEELLG